MVCEREDEACAGFLVAVDELVGLPIQKRPLRAQILVAEIGRMPVVLEVVFVLLSILPDTCFARTSRPSQVRTAGSSGPRFRTWRPDTIPELRTAEGSPSLAHTGQLPLSPGIGDSIGTPSQESGIPGSF